MRTYIAIHYLNLAGVAYTPGEVFCADLDADCEERLLRLGAVKLSGEQAEYVTVPETDDDAMMAPEIDVMDGIAEAAEEAPKKTTRRKRA